MKNKKKNIEFDLFKPYFVVSSVDGIAREALYDLKPLLKHVADNPLVNTKKRIYGDNHMFHRCCYHDDRKIWEIQLLHLREQILPGIADEGGAFELIQLNENQYPAESTTVIFDQNTNILYVQRNIYGTSIRALTGLIQLISPEGICVILKPIRKNTAISKIKESNIYRKVILTADSEQLTNEDKDSDLGKILSNFSKYHGKIVTVTLGFGHAKGVLNKTDTIQLLREAYEFPGTEKLEVSMTESEDAKFEKVDLLDDREKILFSMDYSREKPITHERLFAECLSNIAQ